MFEVMFKHASPAALILIVLAWLMLGVGRHFLLEAHYRRRGVPSNRRLRGPADLHFFHFNAKEWLIEVALMVPATVSLFFIALHFNDIVHLVF